MEKKKGKLWTLSGRRPQTKINLNSSFDQKKKKMKEEFS